MDSLITLGVAILIAYAVVLWLGTVYWTYKDIRDRTQDGWTHTVCVLLVLVFNLPGLLLYLVVRPGETLADAYERRIEAEALMRDLPPPAANCPNCRQSVRDEYIVCPNCNTRIREACQNCERPLELAWVACPYCGSAGPNARTTTTTTSSPPAPRATAPPPAPAAEGAVRPQAQASQRHSAPPPRHQQSTPPPPRSESAAQSFWRRIVG